MRILFLVLALLCSGGAFAQSAPKHYLSAASTNCTLVQAGKVVLRNEISINTTAVIYYLKLYDKATAPVALTDIPVLTIPVLTAAAGGSPPMFSVDGIVFLNGLGICLTGGIADNDNTVAATGVAINLGVSTN